MCVRDTHSSSGHVVVEVCVCGSVAVLMSCRLFMNDGEGRGGGGATKQIPSFLSSFLTDLTLPSLPCLAPGT